MRYAVRQRFRVACVIFLICCAAPAAWAIEPALTFAAKKVVFSGFTPSSDIAVLAVIEDDRVDAQFRRILTRQFLLTTNASGAAEFVFYPELENESLHGELDPDGVWVAIDVATGLRATVKRGEARDLAVLTAEDVQFVNLATTDAIQTSLSVAVMMVRPGVGTLYNDLETSSTSIPLTESGDPNQSGDMKPPKPVPTPINRFQPGDRVIVVDREALRSLEKEF